MGETKRPVRKITPKKNTNTQVKQTENVATVNSTIPAQPVTVSYNPDDTIWTTSVTAGELIMIGKKTKNIYTWSNYGDRTEIDYQDLAAAKSSKNSYIFAPRFIIEDEDLLNSKGWESVKEVYDNFSSISEIESIFDLNIGAFNRAIQNLPQGLVGTVKSIAAEKINNRTLDSISKIEVLDRELGTEFKLYIANM